MPKYIEAATAAEVVSKKHNIPLVDLVDTFAEIPSADVAPVAHGQWIPDEGDVIFICSICDAEISTSWDYDDENMFRFCPVCGAKMDGDKNG